MNVIQRKIAFAALLASLMTLSAYAQETTRAEEPETSTTEERVENPEIGVNIGPTVGIDEWTDWGPQVSIFADGVIYEGLHFGPELGYALQEYRPDLGLDIMQHRISALGRIEYHPGGYLPVLQWLSFGAKAGPVYQYRSAEVLGIEADRDEWAFGFGPMIGVNVPVVEDFTLGAEAGVLFMAGRQFQSAVNLGLSARIWL